MKRKILYFHNGKSTFVEKDIEILKTQFEVIEFYFDVRNKKGIFTQFIKQIFFIFKHFKVKLFVTQFGGYHSFFPSLFKVLFYKIHVLVLSGTDCVAFPSISYGNFYKKYLRWFTKFSITKASYLLPVSKELIYSSYTYQNMDFSCQGVLCHIKKCTTPYKVIYYGYNYNKWYSSPNKEKNSFVTIAADLSTRFGIYLKGIDLILDIAPFYPNCSFYIVGGKTIKNQQNISNNVYLVDKMNPQQLSEFLSNKQFYFQLSMSEGFPNALCEAMLSSCVPIVSNVSSMPFIIEDSGFVLMKKDINELKTIMDNALTCSNFELLQKKARSRIEQNFPLEKRKEMLIQTIKDIISD
ncbi:MAG: glycosyltransferase family 4 protein [Flavobacteriia bacterium]|nr:glycosyltransferase family 4 protein [Flavobacteriia bacterium]